MFAPRTGALHTLKQTTAGGGNKVSINHSELDYRQVLTRAVCGRGRKFSQATHTIHPPENIQSILGAWVINHSFESSRVGEGVEIRGKYDINIWYSCKGNTKTDVLKETVRYIDQVPLSYYDHQAHEGTITVSAKCTQAPNCVEATISPKRDAIYVRVEKEFVVEMVGETKVCVAVFPMEMAEADEKDIAYVAEVDQDEYEELDPDLIIDDLED